VAPVNHFYVRLNIVMSAFPPTNGMPRPNRRIVRSIGAMLVPGTVESAEGVVSLMADRLQQLDLRISARSRDCR
jgi:hypothetical protein